MFVFSSAGQPLKTVTDESGAVIEGFLDGQLFTIPMMSGGEWVFTIGNAIMLLTLLLLFVEILKATRIGNASMVDHGLSTLVFIAALVEFVLVGRAATSLFFFITIAALIDVIAGFSVSIRAARRDVSFGGGGIPH